MEVEVRTVYVFWVGSTCGGSAMGGSIWCLSRICQCLKCLPCLSAKASVLVRYIFFFGVMAVAEY